MGPAIVGAIAGIHAARCREQEIFDKAQRERDLARRAKEAERARSLRIQQAEEQAQHKRRLVAWFSKYDRDASGILEHEEMRHFLTDFMPSAPPPTDAAIEALLSTFPSGVGMEEILAASIRYEAYVIDRERMDQAFKALDIDGSGLLEREELAKVMGDLIAGSPLIQVEDADLAFVYEAVGCPMGEPLSRDIMGLLLPAVADWAKTAKAAASKGNAGEAQPTSLKKNGKSAACSIL